MFPLWSFCLYPVGTVLLVMMSALPHLMISHWCSCPNSLHLCLPGICCCFSSDDVRKNDDGDDDEVLGSDDDEQEDPRSYCKGVINVKLCHCRSCLYVLK